LSDFEVHYDISVFIIFIQLQLIKLLTIRKLLNSVVRQGKELKV